MFNIKTYDTVAQAGRDEFNAKKYYLSDDVADPDGILVHSTPLHDISLDGKLQSIVRIGAGVNTIPVAKCTEKGICVFNCPGGNANAVKELAIAAMIMAMRNGFDAMNWVKNLPGDESDPGKTVEKGKEVYRGPEILGKTIGIIGLGAIGSRMARACDDLGMKVYGYDPFLPHIRSQELSEYVTFTDDVNKLLEVSDIVTVHIPLNEANRGFIGKAEIDRMKRGAYVVNYARGPIIDDDAICDALESGKIKAYATDFPTPRQMKLPTVLCTPHLGAGTPEADVNCSVMAAKQTMDYLENGNISNSVNLPNVSFTRADGDRIAIIHSNKVGMLGMVTEKVSAHGLNIENLVNKSRDGVAYTILDFNTDVPQSLADELSSIDGVIRLRLIK
ncbi:MAG: phosphoglycerate dehydrogenase [Lachnospiraceae bacterium]|nr:phosphoglycerate dehydrogenase [Lachnospiraceae bacterium]